MKRHTRIILSLVLTGVLLFVFNFSVFAAEKKAKAKLAGVDVIALNRIDLRVHPWLLAAA